MSKKGPKKKQKEMTNKMANYRCVWRYPNRASQARRSKKNDPAGPWRVGVNAAFFGCLLFESQNPDVRDHSGLSGEDQTPIQCVFAGPQSGLMPVSPGRMTVNNKTTGERNATVEDILDDQNNS